MPPPKFSPNSFSLECRKFPLTRQAVVEAVSPPKEERIAARPWNGGRRIQFSRPMIRTRPNHDVSAPVLRDRNIDDGAEHEASRRDSWRPAPAPTCRAEVAQRQIVELEVETESKILAEVAGDAGGRDAASAAHKIRGGAVGQTGAASDVESPVVIVFGLWLTLRDFFGRRFLGSTAYRAACWAEACWVEGAGRRSLIGWV